MTETFCLGRTFQFPLDEHADVAALLRLARMRASGVGIDMTGDETGGTFEGTAVGAYRVDERVVHVQVDEKPMFIPWPMIESQLRQAFQAR